MLLTVQEINDALARDAAAFVKQAEAAYAARLEEIATYIRAHSKESPIILLSGPSGSGKTTTARMLERILDGWELETHTLSMDDYFRTVTPEQHVLLERGEFDLESPDRVDSPFLNEQLESIIACRPTPLPRFNFRTHSREMSGEVLTRKPGELVILEGIHALNPAVITLSEEQTVRLYVSVRTRLAVGENTPMHPQKIRLLRRMLRDTRFRGRELTHTLAMYHSVQRGEERYIMPYKYRSSFDVDTFCPYEVSVYTRELLKPLQALAAHPDVADMLPVLEALTPLDESLVPERALIREFVGAGG